MSRTEERVRFLAPAVLSGTLAGLAFPGHGWDGLLWIALVPLLARVSTARQGAFRQGWLAGFAFYLLVLTWLWTLWDWAGPLIAIGYVALCALLGVSWGVWAWGCARAARWAGSAGLLTVAPALWVVLEYGHSLGPLGFTWGALGTALHAHPSLLQLASLTGVWGLSALILWVNAAALLAWRRRRWRFALAALLPLVLLLGWGAWHVRGVERGLQDAPQLRLALVQPNVPQREKTDPGLLEPLRARYVDLLETVADPVDLVVLSESILPTFVLDDPDTLGLLSSFARERDTAVLFGTFAGEGSELYNAAVLLDPSGAVAGRYDKVQLVPFSTEYFPLIEELKALGLDRWLAGLPLGSLTAGDAFRPLEWGAGRVGTPICFESSFGRVSRAFVRAGAQALITITNDAWFKGSPELEQHFAMGAVRAAETGRAFVQVANTGITGAYLPTGAPLGRAAPLAARVHYERIPLLDRETLYVRWGDWFAGAAALALIVVLGWGRRARTQSPQFPA